MEPNIGIDPKTQRALTNQLSVILANEVTLYIKTRKFHWNATGSSLHEIDKLFEDQSQLLENYIDDTAARINKLGNETVGNVREYGIFSGVQDASAKVNCGDMILELLADHESIIMLLRSNIRKCAEKFHDNGTADFLTKLMMAHETTAWNLRRHLN